MNCDVAIVGASSAGLYAAEQLARAGRRVAVFEQNAELTPARRTLIVTPAWCRQFQMSHANVIQHRVECIALASGTQTSTVRLQEPDLIIERAAMTRTLAERAQKAGAQLYCGYRFQGFEIDARGTALRLRTQRGESARVVADAIIGADGVMSDVATDAHLQHPPVVSILQAEVKLPGDWNPRVTQVWFDARETRFFFWLIPESPQYGVVGLVGTKRQGTRLALTRFMTKHGFQPLAFQGAQVALHRPRLKPWGRVGATSVLLVGDAAGHVKNTTVGGTVSGFWGAAAAVRSLLRGTSYSRELRGLKRELDLHWLIEKLTARLDNDGYDNLLKLMTPSVIQFLGVRNRDQMADAFWKLLVLQPRLLRLGAQFLFQAARRVDESHAVPLTTSD